MQARGSPSPIAPRGARAEAAPGAASHPALAEPCRPADDRDVGGESRHLAIDPFQETRFAGCGLQLLDEAGVAARVEHRAEESQLAIPRLLREGRRFDFAVVDGNHRFDGVFLDLVYLGRLLAPGSAVFLDDYQLPAVAKAAAFCTANLAWTLEEASAPDVHHQWAVLRTRNPPLERAFDHFVEF